MTEAAPGRAVHTGAGPDRDDPAPPTAAPQPGRSLRRAAPAVGLLVVLVLLWEAGVAVSGVSPVVLPAPSRVLGALWDFRDAAVRHTTTTLIEAAIGFAVAVALAVGAAIAMDRVAALRRALYPLLVGSQTIPIVAIAPLLVIWLGFGLAPKIVVIVLIAFFPIVVALLDAFAETPPEATDLLRTMGATERQTFGLLRWPAALPGLFTGLRIAVPYAVIGAVFAEYVGAVDGLGIWMQISQNAFRTDLVFAAVLITAVVSVGLFLLVGALERWLVPWGRGAHRASR
jgi:ABC-type nitrate/sulfonate/bicarbonate transport system permease component